ncbi:MAG: L,D-transpeptidase family protein [Acidobacteria bacterium]|nr:L,D-transpeptidase family protein [Acidobacteriota bacterium]
MTIKLLIALAAMAASALPQTTGGLANSMSSADKAVVVVTPDWNVVQGTLQRYERAHGTWQQIGAAIPVVVGRSGIAWDPRIARAYPGVDAGPIKHEGDGRSPAGIFHLKQIFGFSASLPGVDNYLPIAAGTECVDDVHSRSYAQIVDRQKVATVDWNSSEKMREVPGYRWGAVVDYNMENTVPGDGSCIFLHQWSGPTSGTAGCTAMSSADVETLIHWLADDRQAVLVQLPRSEYQARRGKWHLP